MTPHLFHFSEFNDLTAVSCTTCYITAHPIILSATTWKMSILFKQTSHFINSEKNKRTVLICIIYSCTDRSSVFFKLTPQSSDTAVMQRAAGVIIVQRQCMAFVMYLSKIYHSYNMCPFMLQKYLFLFLVTLYLKHPSMMHYEHTQIVS